MPRVYKKLEEKIEGVIPELGLGATVHVGRFTVPCTIVQVGTTDGSKRSPMVGVQTDGMIQGAGGLEFVRDPQGTLMLFTWRKSGRWVRYGDGYKSGPWLELGVRQGRGLREEDLSARRRGATDVLADRLAKLAR